MIKSVNLIQFHITDVNEIHRKCTKYKLLVELLLTIHPKENVDILIENMTYYLSFI